MGVVLGDRETVPPDPKTTNLLDNPRDSASVHPLPMPEDLVWVTHRLEASCLNWSRTGLFAGVICLKI